MKKILIMLSINILSSCTSNSNGNQDVVNHIVVNSYLPEFIVTGGETEAISTSDFLGKSSLLVFFNTTCADCRRELPIVQQVWESLKDNPQCLVVPIARRQTITAIEAYWEKNNFTMPKYIDPDGKVFRLFANSTIPRLYVVNSQGVVTWMAIEKLGLTAEQIITKIKQAK